MRDAPSPKASRSLRTGFITASLFILLPQLAVDQGFRLIGMTRGLASTEFLTATMVASLLVIVGYLWLIGRMAEVQRVLRYNSAMLRAFAAYQSGDPLTVASLRHRPSFHPFGSMTFLLLAVILAALLFSGLGHIVPLPASGWLAQHGALYAAKMLALPIIYALSIEAQRVVVRLWSFEFLRGPLRWIFFAQRFAVRDPDDEQLEVACLALQTMIALERGEEPWP